MCVVFYFLLNLKGNLVINRYLICTEGLVNDSGKLWDSTVSYNYTVNDNRNQSRSFSVSLLDTLFFGAMQRKKGRKRVLQIKALRANPEKKAEMSGGRFYEECIQISAAPILAIITLHLQSYKIGAVTRKVR